MCCAKKCIESGLAFHVYTRHLAILVLSKLALIHALASLAFQSLENIIKVSGSNTDWGKPYVDFLVLPAYRILKSQM